MHALTEKLLATGVIPEQTIRLLRLWNSSFEELPDEIKQARTQEELLKLVDEMARIIESEEEVPELRETEFDLESTRDSMREVSIALDAGDLQTLVVTCSLGKTIGGRYVYFLDREVSAYLDHSIASRGNVITDDGTKYMVTSVEPRYTGDKIKYYILTVEKFGA